MTSIKFPICVASEAKLSSIISDQESRSVFLSFVDLSLKAHGLSEIQLLKMLDMSPATKVIKFRMSPTTFPRLHQIYSKAPPKMKGQYLRFVCQMYVEKIFYDEISKRKFQKDIEEQLLSKSQYKYDLTSELEELSRLSQKVAETERCQVDEVWVEKGAENESSIDLLSPDSELDARANVFRVIDSD